MLELDNKKKLLGLLGQGARVITPNNRLSSALLESFYISNKESLVVKPLCLPYGKTLKQLYELLKCSKPHEPHPLLLNEFQYHYLWQNILRSDTNVIYSEGLLNSVMEAYRSCKQWQMSPEHPDFCYTPQTQSFQRWWQIFENTLQERHLITEYHLIPYLLHTPYSLRDHILVWACFDEFHPQQRALQKHYDGMKIIQYQYDLKNENTLPQVCAAKDTKEEVTQLMHWLHSKLDQQVQRIGVVVPNLHEEAHSLQRTLNQHIDPKLFTLSLGRALSDFPLIGHALVWLKLDLLQITHQQASLLLQSPYLGYAKEEFLVLSQYLQESTLLQKSTLTLNELINDLNLIAPKLASLLNTLLPYPKKATINEWIELFQNRLNHLGYPGSYGLDSQNYQSFNRFITLFDEFRQLHVIQSSLTDKEALAALTDLVQRTIFQPQNKNPVIQILGLLEASGCEFDSLWIMGLTDPCLPQKTRLSAFIPLHLQKLLVMPHSLPERELQLAQQTLQRLQRGCSDMVLSYSKLQGDTPNLPCSLITHFPLEYPLNPNELLKNRSQLIPMEEFYNVPLGLNESISGNTTLLAHQAKCPFKAFAEHRLKAKPHLIPSEGLDDKERGQLIHKVMELLWSTLTSQDQLLSLNAEQLNTLIEKTLNQALNPLKKKRANSFPKLIQEIEYHRLKRLVLASLEWEKTRPPFKVDAVEQTYTLHLAGMDFTVRVDRLDAVGEQKWIIDYKSTLPATKPWNEERPQEPQLLFYALLNSDINTLLFLQLKTGKLICSGLSEEKQQIKGINTLKKEETWITCIKKWQNQLSLLIQEFKQGLCMPQPLNTGICQLCDLHNLCRYRPE